MVTAIAEKPVVKVKHAMSVTVLNENLVRALDDVRTAVAGRPTLPVLSGVKVSTDCGRVRIDASNLDVSISSWIGAKVEHEGGTVLPFKLLSDTAKVTGKVAVVIDGQLDAVDRKATFTGGRATVRMDAFSADDYPIIPNHAVPANHVADIDPAQFAKMMAHVADSVAKDDSRPVLAAIYVKVESAGGNSRRVTFVGADGFRLAVFTTMATSETPLANPVDFMVPKAQAVAMLRLAAKRKTREAIGLYINPARTYATLALADLEVTGCLVQGVYPNYGQLRDDTRNAARFTVDAAEFTTMVKRAAIVARDGSNIVRIRPRLEVGHVVLDVSARADTVADFTGAVDTNDETNEWRDEQRIAFNAADLLDYLGKRTGPVTLGITSASTQAVFTEPDADPEGVYTLIMPMFVQW